MTNLKALRAAYEAAEAAGNDQEAERLWNLFCDARRADNLASEQAGGAGRTWGQIIGLPNHD